jgi:ferredoxin
MKATGQPIIIDSELCGQCGGCVPVCPVDAIYLSPSELAIDNDICTLCGDCVGICPVGALGFGDG